MTHKHTASHAWISICTSYGVCRHVYIRHVCMYLCMWSV